MARKRPTASHLRQPALVCLDGDRPSADGPLLARDEAAALRRSAAVTHAKLTDILNSYVSASAPEGGGRDVAWICGHLNEQQARGQILDRNVSRRAFAVAGERVDHEVAEHDRQL